jgi:EpsI family protein
LALGATALLRIGGQADTPLRGSLDSIPRELMGYSARDQVVSKEEQRVAGMDTYLMRAYLRDSTYFSLYVGYYEAQNQGKSIHSPKNCLPGAGWEPLGNSTREVIVGGNPGHGEPLSPREGRGARRRLLLVSGPRSCLME